jgi:NAD(P)-dependent dehydrogenase (short-subunit alcohol dehydrogenase family)
MHRGSYLARRFAKNYTVALLARKPASFEPIVQEINDAGGKSFGFTADTSDAKSLKSAFEQLKEKMGNAKLAAAVYNVGGGLVRKPFLELSQDEIEGGWLANG